MRTHTKHGSLFGHSYNSTSPATDGTDADEQRQCTYYVQTRDTTQHDQRQVAPVKESDLRSSAPAKQQLTAGPARRWALIDRDDRGTYALSASTLSHM